MLRQHRGRTGEGPRQVLKLCGAREKHLVTAGRDFDYDYGGQSVCREGGSPPCRMGTNRVGEPGVFSLRPHARPCSDSGTLTGWGSRALPSTERLG